jgi:hypothetical protein
MSISVLLVASVVSTCHGSREGASFGENGREEREGEKSTVCTSTLHRLQRADIYGRNCRRVAVEDRKGKGGGLLTVPLNLLHDRLDPTVNLFLYVLPLSGRDLKNGVVQFGPARRRS